MFASAVSGDGSCASEHPLHSWLFGFGSSTLQTESPCRLFREHNVVAMSALVDVGVGDAWLTPSGNAVDTSTANRPRDRAGFNFAQATNWGVY